MQRRFRIPADNRTSVSKLRTTHWQQRLISQHEFLNLIPFFKLPRTILVIILSQWITLETLCIFDTAVNSRNSRDYLLQDIFLDEGFIVPSNSLENRQENSTESIQNAVLLAKYLHFRQLFVKIFDFTHWFFPIEDISDFLQYLWHFDVDNERYRHFRALILPQSFITFELANVVGSKLQYLWYLSLSGCGHALGDFEFQNLIFTCRNLRCLDISNCSSITCDAITFMAKRCALLNHFIWHGHNTNFYVFVFALGEYCRNLQLLDLSSQKCRRMTDRDLGLVNPARHYKHLNYLNLSGCDQLTERGIIYLVSSLKTLEYFTMCFERPGNGTWRGWEGPTPITDQCIIDLSIHNPLLQEIYLRGCDLVTNNCLLPLSRNCKVLKHLDVTGSSCTPEGYDSFNHDNQVIIPMGEYIHVPFYVQHLYIL